MSIVRTVKRDIDRRMEEQEQELEAAEAAAAAETEALPSVYAAGDDELSALDALRIRLARAIDDEKTPAKDLSPLSRRYQEVVDRLREARSAMAEAAKAAKAKEASGYVYDPEEL